jgi:hypothetical protein
LLAHLARRRGTNGTKERKQHNCSICDDSSHPAWKCPHKDAARLYLTNSFKSNSAQRSSSGSNSSEFFTGRGGRGRCSGRETLVEGSLTIDLNLLQAMGARNPNAFAGEPLTRSTVRFRNRTRIQTRYHPCAMSRLPTSLSFGLIIFCAFDVVISH